MPTTRNGGPSRAGKSSSRAKGIKVSVDQGAPSPSRINLWGIAGRQQIMEMRRLWQLKIPRR
ncbi:MAG: hypothetical protein JRF35_11490 [Deltaproteobacteria bacterium]|nr:hypothetical protein [Deltaproteobacteria bacterium]